MNTVNRRKINAKNKINSEKNHNTTNLLSKMDSLIDQSKKRSRDVTNRSSSTKILPKALILTSVLIISAFIVFNLPNSGPNIPPIDLNKELPNNMIQKNDPMLMSENNVQSAYDYAKSHSSLLEQLECYCGCAYMHDNNRQCFWKNDGTIDTHAQTCGVCVYIALAARDLNDAGWTPQEIRYFIDSQYGQL